MPCPSGPSGIDSAPAPIGTVPLDFDCRTPPGNASADSGCILYRSLPLRSTFSRHLARGVQEGDASRAQFDQISSAVPARP